jgi:hypothetical protein
MLLTSILILRLIKVRAFTAAPFRLYCLSSLTAEAESHCSLRISSITAR